MKCEWDEEKRRKNLEKHGVDFVAAAKMFEGPVRERLDARRDYGEERWHAVGWIEGRLVIVVYTERDDVTRIISARRAAKHEEEDYHLETGHER